MPRAKKPPACVVCRTPAERGMHNLVQCGRNQYMCKTCAETVLLCFGAKVSELPEHAQAMPAPACPTPQEIVAALDKTIIGQDAAKRMLAVAGWKHMQRQHGNTAVPPAHVLLYGPTGCGKTYLAKSIAKIMDVPFVSVDATTFSEAGYKGRDVRDIIFDIGDVSQTRKRAKTAVVFVDEFDKLAARGGSERQAYQRGTQHGFLTLPEGGEVTAECRYDTATLDVSGLLFIFAGAFSDLSDTVAKRIQGVAKSAIGFGNTLKSTLKPDIGSLLAQAAPTDFVQYGLEPELIGRIPVLAPVMPLEVGDLVRIQPQQTALLQRNTLVFLSA